MKLITTCIALMLSLQLFAVETKLATITSDVDKDTTVFYLETTADGQVDILRYMTVIPGGQITADTQFTLEQVRAGEAVLKKKDGRDIIILYVDDSFSAQTGGNLRLNYLFNGVKGTRQNLHLKLVKSDVSFHLTTPEKQKKITKLFIKGNWIRVIGLVGIKDIVPGYDR